MKIHCIYGIDYDSNVYVINGEIPTVIDTGTGLHQEYVSENIKKHVDPKEIRQIIITHEHFDHCGGVKEIHEMTNGKAKIIAHEKASDKIEHGKSDFAIMLGSKMPNMPVDVKLKEGDAIKIGDETFTVFHTPGHSPGSLCLYSKSSKSLISGDTIFPFGSFGRYDFPGGDAGQLRISIERLSKLDVMNLYPGHETVVEGDGDNHIKMTLQNTEYLR
jgi:glyoxylase-like metal-dependent hydrolase (beta-lactamase superfamily II)